MHRTKQSDWERLLRSGFRLLRHQITSPAAQAAIKWFNTEYSEAAVRARRSRVGGDLPTESKLSFPCSALMLPGVEEGTSADVWRISAALVDLQNVSSAFRVTPWNRRADRLANAFKVLLVIALAMDADADEYLGDIIELDAFDVECDSNSIDRGWASLSGLDNGVAPWPRLLNRAIEEIKSVPESAGAGCSDDRSHSSDERRLPTMGDLIAAAEISASTFRRLRQTAQIALTLKGAAARNRRYSYAEVDRLIRAAFAGSYLARELIAERWTKWSGRQSTK